MVSRFARGAAAALLLAGLGAVGTAGSAQARMSVDPTLSFDSPTLNIEYGQIWYFQATGANAIGPSGPWSAVGAMTNVPSGYAPAAGAYQQDFNTVIAYIAPQDGARPLGAGSYTVNLTIHGETDGGHPDGYTTTPAGQLTIAPAALGIALAAQPDPSNPANAIISARFTGAFLDSFFTTTDPTAPLTPAGTWKITASDADGNVAHEFTSARSEQDDVMGVSTYWSDVPPGDYTIHAVFTPSGGSSNFAITNSDPVAFSAAAPPGATSTATPAPPAPPATQDSGMTLPLWVPIAAGVLTAGLLALMIVQIVRLRRTGVHEASGVSA